MPGVGKGELEVVVVVVELDPGALRITEDGVKVPLFEIGAETGALEYMLEGRVGTGELDGGNELKIPLFEIGPEACTLE